jgi:hypothetical protein
MRNVADISHRLVVDAPIYKTFVTAMYEDKDKESRTGAPHFAIP